MGPTLDKKFAKVWQSLKKHAAVKSSPWFKKADAAVSIEGGSLSKGCA